MDWDLKYDFTVEDKLAKPYSIFAKIDKLIPEGLHILDVGCHSGQFGACLKRKGCRVTGLEINPKAAEKARQVLDEVIVADVEQSETFRDLKQRYDVILFLDILEHCRFPEKVLQGARNVLASNGSVIASIPNIANWSIRMSLLLGRFDYEPMGIMDETHLKFYTIKTARQLFDVAGYKIDLMDHRFSLPLFRVRRFIGGTLARVLGPRFPGLFSYQMVIKARPIVPANGCRADVLDCQ
jgi:2-polyprenyl-3-methyl-5-hydroxy-6-metoxy-1,4-benzoquinol methylase